MLRVVFRTENIFFSSCRNFSTTSPKKFKVTVCGGCGGIGAPLSLLLKMNPLVSEIRIQDIVKETLGVAKDLSHIEYPADVRGFIGDEGLKTALKCADIVAIPAGVPRKPGMTRDDLFSSNAIVVKTITEAISQLCPTAMIVIITNPINTLIPIACEIMKSAGKLDSKRIFGVTTLDNVRASTFAAEKLKMSPREVNVPVIGGHSGVTIIPLFSRAHPNINFPLDEIKALTARVQDAGTEVVKAKAGTGSATLSMAYAAARFINSLLCGMKGEPDIVECTYVRSNAISGVEYFGGPVILGKNGVEKICPIGSLSDFEKESFEKCLSALKKDIKKGIDYVKTGSQFHIEQKKALDTCSEKTKKSHAGASEGKQSIADICAKIGGSKSVDSQRNGSGSKICGGIGKTKHVQQGSQNDKNMDPCAEILGQGIKNKAGKETCAGGKREKRQHASDPCAQIEKSSSKTDGDPCAAAAGKSTKDIKNNVNPSVVMDKSSKHSKGASRADVSGKTRDPCAGSRDSSAKASADVKNDHSDDPCAGFGSLHQVQVPQSIDTSDDPCRGIEAHSTSHSDARIKSETEKSASTKDPCASVRKKTEKTSGSSGSSCRDTGGGKTKGDGTGKSGKSGKSGKNSQKC